MTSPIKGAHYRYVYYSLRTEQVIAEIPLFGTYIDLELNVGGRMDGSFALDMTGYNNQTLIDATIPGRCGVVVYRNDIPIWGGFVWSRTYQSQSKSVQLFSQSWENYPAYQRVRHDINLFNDQLSLFNSLWTDMMSLPGRDVNIQIPTAGVSGINQLIDILSTDNKFYSELMSSLADGAQGFDWTIDHAIDLNMPAQHIKTLRVGYPTLGQPLPQNFIPEYPGSILNYYATESMADASTNVLVTGNGSGSDMITGTFDQSAMVAQGFPTWDVVVSRKDVTTNSIADSIATQEAANRKPPRLTFKPELKSDQVPEFGSFGRGDSCRLTVVDARFPYPGFQFDARIAKWTLQPGSTDNVDFYNLIFVGDTN